jgi:ribosomal protein S18 acetylase RimI-like enzyme
MSTSRLRRLATKDDLVAVYAIYMDPEVSQYLGIDPVPLDGFRPVFDALLATESFFVAPRDGIVRGFYRVTRHPGRARHAAMLETLAIAPADRGTGFARALIDEAFECMRGDGIRRVELLVEADNPRGIAFYRKLGFEQEGLLKKAYKRATDVDYVDEVLMAKWLGA